MVLAFMACKHSHEDGDGHHHGHDHGAEMTTEEWKDVDDLHILAMENGSYLDDMEEAFEKVLKDSKEDENALKGFSKEEIENVLTQVEKANQDMMSWMDNHGTIRASLAEKTDEEVDKIIETERQNIQRINDDTEKAVSAANEVLKVLGINLDEDSDEHDHEHDHDHSHDGHEH